MPSSEFSIGSSENAYFISKNEHETYPKSSSIFSVYPRVHFHRNGLWINDPNGLAFYDGLYRLFYQHNPNGVQWGNVHWGSAYSRNLLDWTVGPAAIKPNSTTGAPFSGSAVEVNRNESENSGLYALYTRSPEVNSGNRQAQHLAIWNESTHRFVDVLDTPVIPNPGVSDFRDPRIWRASGWWYAATAAGKRIVVHRSSDLLSWSVVGSIDPGLGATTPNVGAPATHRTVVTDPFVPADRDTIWECPDLIHDPAGGGDAETGFILASRLRTDRACGGNVVYRAVEYSPESVVLRQGETLRPLDIGHDYYASQSWSLPPDQPGPTIVAGWINNWAYARELADTGYNGALTIPRIIETRTIGDRTLLTQRPIDAVESLRTDLLAPDASTPRRVVWRIPKDTAVDLSATLSPRPGCSLTLSLCPVTWEGEPSFTVTLLFGRSRFSVACGRWVPQSLQRQGAQSIEPVFFPWLAGAPISVRAVVDGHILELFVDDGLATLTELLFLPSEGGELSLEAVDREGGGNSAILRPKLYALRPISLKSSSVEDGT